MRPRSYLVVFVAVLAAALGSVGAVVWTIMLATGEHRSIADVVGKQQQAWEKGRLCLYGTALEHTTTHYKLLTYEHVKPDVLVLGSSRVMQMRATLFSGGTVNAGGAMGSPGTGYHFLRAALARHKPRHVLIGVDFWWFNEAFDEVENLRLAPHALTNPTVKIGNYLLPMKWLYEGKIEVAKLPVYASNCHFGAIASTRWDGFGPDGSYFYNSSITGAERPRDAEFRDTLARIKDGRNRFQHGSRVSEGHYKNFRAAIELLRSSGVAYTMYLPALAPTVRRAMLRHDSEFSYVRELERRLKDDFQAVSFHDVAGIGATDCEFVDGFHPGDVADARVLNSLASQNPDLGALIDREAIGRALAASGRAYGGHYDFGLGPEIDFLRLGCDKSDSGPAAR